MHALRAVALIATWSIFSAMNLDPLAAQPLVQASLVANQSALVPGKTLRVAVTLTIAPEWHIYWSNPGDSGLATRIDWKLPPGYSAEPLEFPTPKRFTQTGDIIGYGYEKSVTLLTTISIPPDAKPADKQTLTANISWLSCKENCIPGDSTLTLTLPVASTSEPTHEKTFAAAEANLPQPKPPSEVLKITARTTPAGQNHEARVDISWQPNPARELHVEGYPAALEGYDLSEVKTETTANNTSLLFTIRKLAGARPPAEKASLVIGYTAPNGERKSFIHEIPLTQPPQN